jgi:hypothetical protein
MYSSSPLWGGGGGLRATQNLKLSWVRLYSVNPPTHTHTHTHTTRCHQNAMFGALRYLSDISVLKAVL